MRPTANVIFRVTKISPATRAIVNYDAPNARTKNAARGLQIEDPFARRIGRRDATHLRGVFLEVRALAAGLCRKNVQLIITAPVALLQVDRTVPPLIGVKVKQPLRQERRVGLEAVALARLETVARIMAAQKEVHLNRGRRV